MVFIRLSGTRRTPASNWRMTPAGADDFVCPHPISRSQISSSSPLKTLLNSCMALVPRRGFKPYFYTCRAGSLGHRNKLPKQVLVPPAASQHKTKEQDKMAGTLQKQHCLGCHFKHLCSRLCSGGK